MYFLSPYIMDFAIMDVLNGLSKSIKTKFDCSTIGYLRTDNFPLREIGAWKRVRYNGGYVVNGVL